MTTMYRSAALPAFEDTRPAPYWAAAQPPATGQPRGGAAADAPAPLPQDAWVLDLPELDPEPVPEAWFGDWRWPRIAGLAAAALLTLVALGLAASLLDAQRPRPAEGSMRFASDGH